MYTLIIEDSPGHVATQLSFDGGTYTIGRVEGNDIILPSNSVSRTHARIFVADGKCYVEDLGSANGMTLNGGLIQKQVEFAPNAVLRIGEYTLYLMQKSSDLPETAMPELLKTQIVKAEQCAFKLVRVGDMFAGEEFSLNEPVITVGRTEDNYILLTDPSVSRNQARIISAGPTYSIEDLFSSNGTFVNGKRLKKARMLNIYDEIKFGNIRFLFVPSTEMVDIAAYASKRSSDSKFLFVVVVAFVSVLAVILAIFLNVYQDKNDNTRLPTAKENGTTTVGLTNEKFEEANNLIRARKWDRAEELLLEIMVIDPNYPQASVAMKKIKEEKQNALWSENGDELFNKGSYEDAIDFYEKIDGSSVYARRASDRVVEARRKIATEKYVNAKMECDLNPSVDCVSEMCDAAMNFPRSKKEELVEYLLRLHKAKSVRNNKDLRKKADTCIDRLKKSYDQ